VIFWVKKMSDEDLFTQAMAGVRPIKPDAKPKKSIATNIAKVPPLDMHTPKQARSPKHMSSPQEDGAWVLRVIHGRGLHSPDGRSIIKQAVYDYLRCGSLSGYVLAVIPCPKSAGGACLILLRRDK